MKERKEKKYEAIYRKIKGDIEAGRIKEGEKLPSKRNYAMNNGVSVITVDAAYRLLIDEGYVYSRERSGFFALKTEHKSGGENVADFTAERVTTAEVDFKFSVLSKIMRKVITDYDKALLLKPPAFGCEELRRAISEYLYRYRDMRVDKENIVIGSGSEFFYGMIVNFFGRDKVYGLEDPSYEKIAAVIKANGGKCEFLKMGKNGIESDALKKSGADILHVTPFNSYPTGITADFKKRKEYVEWANAKKGYIVEDDIDSEFAVGAKPVQTVFSLSKGKRVIYLNTFSRSLAPSMRMGYMILPDDLMEEYKEKSGFYSCPVPAFDQYVLAEFIAGGYFERHLNRMRRKIKDAATRK